MSQNSVQKSVVLRINFTLCGTVVVIFINIKMLKIRILIILILGPAPCLPLLDVLLCDWLWRFPPRTEDPTPRKAVEIELTTDRRVRTARVRYVVAVERHHVTGDVTAGGGV